MGLTTGGSREFGALFEKNSQGSGLLFTERERLICVALLFGFFLGGGAQCWLE